MGKGKEDTDTYERKIWTWVGLTGGGRSGEGAAAGGQRRWAADPRRIRSAGGGGVLVIRDGGGGGCRRRGGVSPDRRRRLRLRLVRMVADARAGWRWPESEEGRRRFRRERESGDEERREEGCEQLRVGFFWVKQVVKADEKNLRKKPDESGGTKINPERGLPTKTLGVEIFKNYVLTIDAHFRILNGDDAMICDSFCLIM